MLGVVTYARRPVDTSVATAAVPGIVDSPQAQLEDALVNALAGFAVARRRRRALAHGSRWSLAIKRLLGVRAQRSVELWPFEALAVSRVAVCKLSQCHLQLRDAGLGLLGADAVFVGLTERVTSRTLLGEVVPRGAAKASVIAHVSPPIGGVAKASSSCSKNWCFSDMIAAPSPYLSAMKPRQT